MAVKELKYLLREYEMYDQLKKLKEMEELLKQVPEQRKFLNQGIGIISVTSIIAEIGDISRFEDARQIQKNAGLSLIESSSGNIGATTISKRRKRLRTVLFRVILPMVSNNQEFKELHLYYTTRKDNPLKKKQSLILLCCKLIRIIFVMIKKQIPYDGNKLMKDIKRPAKIAA